MCEGQASVVSASCSPKLPIICRELCFCSSSRLEVSLCAGLGVNAYREFLTSALLTPKSNITDEGVSTYSLTLKQQGEWVVCDPAAAAGQAQKRVALVHRLPDAPGSPVGIGFHGGIIAWRCRGASRTHAGSGGPARRHPNEPRGRTARRLHKYRLRTITAGLRP